MGIIKRLNIILASFLKMIDILSKIKKFLIFILSAFCLLPVIKAYAYRKIKINTAKHEQFISSKYPHKENFFALIEKVYKLKNYDEEVTFECLQETLWQAYNNPINLNNPNLQDLIDLSILSSKQIHAFISHINNFGPLISIYELNVIPEFDKKTIILLMPFTKVVPVKSISWTSTSTFARSYIYLRYKPYPKNLDKKPKPPLGSPFSLRLKSKINLPYNIKAGFLTEKRPCEIFIYDSNTNRYFFNSFSASLEITDALYVGDYQFGFGQGIISSEGFHINKALTPTYIIRCQRGLRSYQSLYRYDIYRGIASTVTYKDLNFTFLFSDINQDAEIKGLLTESIKKDKDLKLPLYANSAPNNTIYDSVNKLKNKGTLKERIYGTSIVYNKKEQNIPFNTGIALLYKTLNPPVLRNRKRNDSEYIFKGNVNINYSYFCTLYLNNICFFTEWAYSISKIYKKKYSPKMKEYFSYNKDKSNFGKSGANIVGAIVAINKRCDLGILFRDYGPYFHSIRGNSYGQKRQNRNERGFVISNRIQPTDNAVFDNSIDIFWYPYCSYKFYKPSKGIEYRCKLEYIFNKKHFTTFSSSFKNKDKEISIGKKQHKTKMLGKQKSILFKICHKWKINTKISTKTHMQASFVKMPDVKKDISKIDSKYTYSRSNFLLAQDIEYKFTKLTTRLRLALFNIGNKQESMLYLHENGPLYYSTMPRSYKDIGHKVYILLIYKPIPTLRLDFKYDISRISCSKDFISKTIQTFIMQATFSL